MRTYSRSSEAKGHVNGLRQNVGDTEVVLYTPVRTARAVGYNSFMPTYPHIEQYRIKLQELIEFGGSDNEQNIRRAFENCLDAYCREGGRNFYLIAERSTPSGARPDGTVVDSLRQARGFWEAKDSHDDLDAEIQKKFNAGYRLENIVFEDSSTAVLFQGQQGQQGQTPQETLRVDMSHPEELHSLIVRFLDYERPKITEFRQAQQQFKSDLPSVISSLRESVEAAEAGNPNYRAAAADFLAVCQRSISPAVTGDDVREMLLQHILTQDIFKRVVNESQFRLHSANNIASKLISLEGTFFTDEAHLQALTHLQSYYAAIGRAADEIAERAEKQRFLKGIYEDFYKAYNPAAADRLGVVYTPNEVVDFIIRGADYLLQKHFGRTLADDNVQILDPATGTGTFVTSLIDYLPLDRLERKYRHEIHANEVAILPYHIANLNIEYSYTERTGRYLEFPNLCFVDTLDNMDWQQSGATGGAVTRQGAFNLGGLSEENWIRVQEQNEKPISVIIGNPPYNDQQSNWYDLNPNRKYPEIDRRIRDTYVKEGTAQRTHQYDMYKRFIRWASDRLADDGIIAFVTNRAYLDTGQDDGFRKVAAKEFSDLYVLDLGSDVRRNPKISGTTHNVFGIQTGVAIGFFVREKSKLGECGIHYTRREDAELATDKLAYLRKAQLDDITFDDITPDEKDNWLDQSNSNFELLMPLANRQTKLAKTTDDEQAVFGLYSVGISTNRDEWVYDFDEKGISDKVLSFCRTYRSEMQRFEIEKPDVDLIGNWVNKSIKWTTELEQHLVNGDNLSFSERNIVLGLYRPYVAKHCYYAPIITHRRYQMPQIFPHELNRENKVICFPGNISSNGFQVLATDRVYSHDLLKTTQCLPLHRYTAQGERVSNITAWGLRQFREHYGDDSITAEDIFAYTYAALHDPAYRERYEVDLLREFPRLPFHEEFAPWAKLGQELLDLHVGFESAEPFALERVEKDGDPGKAALKADKTRGAIVLDGKTMLTGVPEEAWEYRLGSRSALEWVLDQYKEKTPRDPTVRDRFNTYRFADYKEQVIDLLQRVCTVSVKTVRIVDQLNLLSDIHQI